LTPASGDAPRKAGRWPAFLLCGLCCLLAACGGPGDAGDTGHTGTTLTFWAMGREGEIVKALVPEFEHRHPGVRVKVQQVPWSAGHEKLLTAYAGDTLPDVFQLGSTWLPEFAALRAIVPIDPFLDAAATVPRADYFPGILATSEIDGRTWGLPWYVDTRVVFYNRETLARAGFDRFPDSVAQWRAALERLKTDTAHPIYLPLGEWELPVILALQNGAALLDDGTRHPRFAEPAFSRGFATYVDFFRAGLAPAAGTSQIANLYQDFARGEFAMFLSGPWSLGELDRRLTGPARDSWMTAPLPGPAAGTPGVSLAGGSSLVIAQRSRHAALAWSLIEFLAEPARQAEFFRLSGDLPARRSAWDDPALAGNPRIAAFRSQLEHVAAPPAIPEWERIAAAIARQAEAAVRDETTAARAVAELDAEVDRLLEKRRWLLDRHAGANP
jgi:multiple sugar transport system substrate-binding protein